MSRHAPLADVGAMMMAREDALWLCCQIEEGKEPVILSAFESTTSGVAALLPKAACRPRAGQW